MKKPKILSKKPVTLSIDELTKLLNHEEDVCIQILPNGQVTSSEKNMDSNLCGRKPLTFKEDLGGEYGVVTA